MSLGVFTSDYYNAACVLPVGQYNTTAATSGTIAAANLAGGQDTYLLSSAATALTTDTAANIIARLQNAVIVQYAANGYLPPGPGAAGVPNLLNLNYLFTLINTDGSTLTLSAGTGVTITGTATVATTTSRQYLVTVTGPSTVTFQNLGGSTTL